MSAVTAGPTGELTGAARATEADAKLEGIASMIMLKILVYV
jgi:hypothetical protein